MYKKVSTGMNFVDREKRSRRALEKKKTFSKKALI